jgi:HEPN domain-containing protein
MRTPEQVKWDFVQQWLDRAHKDLTASEVLLKERFEDYESVGVHAQQSAEKFICNSSW